LSKCQELHQIANDAKEKLQQMQKDCLMKIDENCTALTEKHNIEVQCNTLIQVGGYKDAKQFLQ